MIFLMMNLSIVLQLVCLPYACFRVYCVAMKRSKR